MADVMHRRAPEPFLHVPTWYVAERNELRARGRLRAKRIRALRRALARGTGGQWGRCEDKARLRRRLHRRRVRTQKQRINARGK